MKRASEGAFGKALREVGMDLVVYKPPDDARNWKPCDFMVWGAVTQGDRTAWFECKDVDSVGVFALNELRQSQMQGIRDAARLGFPYWLAVYWRRTRTWTISDARLLLEWVDEQDPVTSVKRELLMSRFGVDSSPRQLSSTLAAVMRGEVP